LSKSVWFITGATRGLGAAIADAARLAGHEVVATGRRGSITSLDITNPADVSAAVAATLQRFGRIDVLVNNAGFAQLGAFECVTEAEMRAQFETNVFGTMSVTRAVLPAMRAQRSGRIFNLSSMAGYIGGTHYAAYAASKFAVEGFTESLAAEVAPFGIFVTLIEPGFFRTDFLRASTRYGPSTIADYDVSTRENQAELEAHYHDPACDPRKLADVVLALSASPAPPVRCTLGIDAIGAIERANASTQAEIERWRDLCSLPADVKSTTSTHSTSR
jgi:NAD(P)-dependent dehydrogenase (short-subunit alcohol dehydrogenase family)